MKKEITIPGHYIHFFEQDFTRDLFVNGLIEISKQEEPSYTKYGNLNEALAKIATGVVPPRRINNIPPFDNDGRIKGVALERYGKVSRGLVPVNFKASIELRKLEFKNITTVDKRTLVTLTDNVEAFIESTKRNQKRHWVEYLYSTLRYCAKSGELCFK